MDNGNNFWIGIAIGFGLGFFVFTAFGREIISTSAERVRYEARESIIPRIRGK